MTVTAPTTRSPTFTLRSGGCRHEHVHARSEFHNAEPLPRLHVVTCFRAAHDAPSQDTDDLTDDNRLPPTVDPHLRVLVEVPGVGPVRRQKAAWMVPHLCHPPANRHPVDVDVRKRQEHADLLPTPWRTLRSRGRSSHHHPAVGRRQHPVGSLRDHAIRVPEEQEEQAGEHDEHQPHKRADGERGSDRKRQGAADEGPTRRIDFHEHGAGCNCPSNTSSQLHPALRAGSAPTPPCYDRGSRAGRVAQCTPANVPLRSAAVLLRVVARNPLHAVL